MALALVGCASSPAKGSALALPPAHGRFSYQIGGSYTPASSVTIVDRDQADPADPKRYSICYINAFQAQTDAVAWWSKHHPALLLRDAMHHLIIDKDWNEPLFDISTPARRSELLTVIGGWIDGCAAHGYRAVEADNLDSYTRSEVHLTVADALAFAGLLTARAHHDHVAIGQKNAAQLSPQAHKAGFDFAVAEECQVYSECDSYTAVYAHEVIEIEYTDQPAASFTNACRLRGKTISVVLRDRDVTPLGDPHHVERWCP